MSLALNGNMFFLTTATAGKTVPVQADNLVTTFSLLNPAGSGKFLELLAYSYGVLNATTVVSDVSLWFQLAPAALGTTTALTIRNALLGDPRTSVCTGYSAGTVTGSLIKGPTLLSFGAVTTTNPVPINYEFNGRIIVPPNTLITTAGTAAQTQAAQQTLYWIERPSGT